jgi:hypothetical protein
MKVAFLLYKIAGGDLVHFNKGSISVIRTIKNNEEHLITGDPVRPHIPFQQRMGNGRNVVVLDIDGEVGAVVCTALVNTVPATEEELFEYADPMGDILIAYTVWSYKKGAGRKIINQLRDSAIDEKCTRLVTLSPKTEMAERFHISNGAKCISRNESSNNFEYDLA